MVHVGSVFILVVILVYTQVFLSSRMNKFYGLVIPVLNLIISTSLAMMTSDWFVASFVFFTTGIPTVLWFLLYKVFRSRYERKLKSNLSRMKIQDM